MNLFDEKLFKSELADIHRGDSSKESPLVLDVCVICGSFGSSIKIKDFVDFFVSQSTTPIEFESDDPDVTILIDICNKTKQKDVKCLSPCGKMTVSKIIKKQYSLEPDTIRIRYKPNCKKSKLKKKRGEDAFYNCINIEFILQTNEESCSNISAKLFPNGKLQVAGCKNLSVCNEVPQIVFDFLNEYGKNYIHNPELFKIQDFKIVMLKTSFKFGYGLHLDILKDKINEHNVRNENSEGLSKNWRNATYEPSTFPGMNAKYWLKETKEKYIDKIKAGKNVGNKINGQATVIVFRQGNASITGAKTINELRSAYHSVIDIVQKYSDEIVDNEIDEISLFLSR